MARVLRSRQSVNNEITSDSPPRSSGETIATRSGRSKRFQTPDSYRNDSSTSRRNSQASVNSLLPNGDQTIDAKADYDDLDGEAILVRPRPRRMSSQDSPRKRRKTSQGIARVPGSPNSQLLQSLPTTPVRVTRQSVGNADHANEILQNSAAVEQEMNDFNKTSAQILEGKAESPDKGPPPSIKPEAPSQEPAQTDEGDVKYEVASSEEKDTASLLPGFQESSFNREDQSVVSEAGIEASVAPSVTSQGADEEERPATPSDPNELGEEDLPPPFFERSSTPSESAFSDPAAYILISTYQRLPSPQQFITALTKHAPTARSTETLYALAENTQRALLAWQDEFLILDKKTAPIANPPKKPATGGREPQDPARFEASKEADLYSAHGKHDSHGHGSNSNGELGAGRELRRRRDAGVIDGLNISDDDAGAGTDRGKGKRSRKPAKRFDGGRLGTVTPELSGSGAIGTRRRRTAAGATGDGRRPGRPSGLGQTDGFLSPTPDGSEAGDDDQMYGQRRRARAARGGGGSSKGAKRRKQRVKSEKRSESMTAWWAERKRKAAELKIRELREKGLLDVKEADELGHPTQVSNNAGQSRFDPVPSR